VGKTATKVAVSLPEPLYRALERARRRLGKSRSAVFQEALREWLRRGVQADLVRDYEAGYRAQPERERDAEAALATAVALLGDDEDW
jgi:metal-responsive CopG/Arc/MetJ family transcriptional regulator